MRLWTIQSIAAWNILQRDRVLVTTGGCVERHLRHPYGWMTRQMERRMKGGSGTASWPLWAWYQWCGVNRRKPDLRSTCHVDRGQRAARIEFEHVENGVLLSDFSLWHYVLNNWYLPETMADGEAFEAELSAHEPFPCAMGVLPGAYRRRVEDSWNRIFDLDWAAEDISDPYPRKQIQATFWELRVDQIRDVKIFTGR